MDDQSIITYISTHVRDTDSNMVISRNLSCLNIEKHSRNNQPFQEQHDLLS